jgi:predicted DNA-binding transcriptional regulator AlpA
MPTATEARTAPTLLDEFLELPEAARQLGVTPRTLGNWLRAGTAPPSIKIAHHRIFDREKLRAWLLSRETTGAPVRRSRRRGRK